MSETAAAAVRAAVEEFIHAFDTLEWERFRRCFAPDATVFFPFDFYPRRADGKAEVEAGFKRFFDEVRAKTSGPPYSGLAPRDVTVRIWGDIALVTFHLERVTGVPGMGRRTLLLERQTGEWRIVHLHASNIAAPGA